MRAITLLSLPIVLALAACGSDAPKCETEADLAKMQIDIGVKLQELAEKDPAKADKIMEKMMTAELDLEKAMSGDISGVCKTMQSTWSDLH